MISVCSLMAQIHEWLNYLISYSLTMTTTTTMTRTIAPPSMFLYFSCGVFFSQIFGFLVFSSYKFEIMAFIAGSSYKFVIMDLIAQSSYKLVFVGFVAQPTQKFVSMGFIAQPTYKFVNMGFLAQPTYKFVLMGFIATSHTTYFSFYYSSNNMLSKETAQRTSAINNVRPSQTVSHL